ncbi:MAG TPA: hypothetical protein VHK27_05560 [Gammaproteobacteria bacterium]|nr:hypothetical protein [Gammaproteobacteria bacterium]
MRVRFKTMFATQEMPLEKALMPDNWNEGGIAERAYELAKTNAEVMSRLLAHLVETEQMPIETAFQIAGVYVEDLEVIK